MAAQPEDRLKVFISYSREDLSFAKDVQRLLEHEGFEVLLDQHSIKKGEENWKERLGELILDCDTVVFVLSDVSARSEICIWEVAEAQRLNKRRLVVTGGPLSEHTAPPPGLEYINWIHCWNNPQVENSSLVTGILDLSVALRTDHQWLRQGTELQKEAVRWDARGGGLASTFLLQGERLKEAEAWVQATPKSETIPEVIGRFLAASTQAEANRKAEADANLADRQKALNAAAKASERVRRTGLIGAGVSFLFLVAASIAGWWGIQNLNEAEQQKTQNIISLSQLFHYLTILNNFLNVFSFNY